MKIRPAVSFAFGLLILMGLTRAEADFVLTSEGKPQAGICLLDRVTTGPTVFAAHELRRYVEIISGAELAIDVEPSKQANIILTSNPAAAASLGAAKLEPRNEDHYMLQVTGDKLFIVGASPRAVLYGVYDLLERLGCGWCVPGDDTVPQQASLSIGTLNVNTAPVFKHRMMLDFPLTTVAQSIAIVDWIAKNRMNWVHPCANAHGEPVEWYNRRDEVVPQIEVRGLNLIFGGHTMHTWVSPEHFEEHPEWFAYIDGERKAPTLCVTNAAMEQELVKNMRAFIDRCPEVDVVDLWHPDGQAFCHCPVCTRGLLPESTQGKLPEGMPADVVQSAYVITYIEFMNRVAAEIGQSHPDVMISPLIYGPSDRAMPDGCPALADNLMPGLAHIFRDSYRPLAGEPKSALNMRFLGNDVTWMAKSQDSYIYEYYNCWIPPFIYPGSRVIARDLQILNEVGAQGSSSDMYGYSPINMYVAARALWDPQADWAEMVRDYHQRYFIDVASEMAQNWIDLENGIYGMQGYQGNGAMDTKFDWMSDECGLYLKSRRTDQIAFHEQMIAQTDIPLVRTRLERSLKPWKVWGMEAQWWAFPEFEGEGPRAPAVIPLPPGMEQ